MPRKQPELTRSQIGQCRARLAKKVSQIGDRLSKQALGELKNPQGDSIEMSRAQLDASKILLSHTLPAMQSMELQDITEKVSYTDIEAQYQAAMASLTVQDLRMMLESMEPDDRDALLNSVGETRQ